MCGIAGIFSKDFRVTQNRLQDMAEVIKHRGPDSDGFYVSKNNQVGLAHNRLSIIDTSENADQPLENEDKSIWLIFNGEIYNFQALRDDLIKKGHKFKSQSDSEVLVHLYEEKGIGLLKELNGMFAFCLYDERKNRLFLARDRVGIKPLYYYHRNGTFAFSSELKSLLTLPFLSKELDLRALDLFFTLGYIPEDLSIFKEITKVRPAQYLVFDGKTLNVENYWSLKTEKDKFKNFHEADLIDEAEKILRDSVKIRMVSDVPIGSFLSGGLDSSLVTAVMAQESAQPINTFTIGFESKKHDEVPYARIVAKEVKSNHREHYVKINAADSMDNLIYHFDEPFADSSLIPTYYISKMAKKDVTVILSGDGGDELFGGYNWYTWVLCLEDMKRKLGHSSVIFQKMSQLIPETWKGKHLLSVLNLSAGEQFVERVSIFNELDKRYLYKNGLKETRKGINPVDKIEQFINSNQDDLIHKMSLTDFHYYLPEDILTKVDRASMAVSLETRVPWLDHRLVEFAYNLPSSMKINGTKKKYLTKKLAGKLLPEELPLERKQGFCVPIDEWMRGQLGHRLEDELKNKALSEFLDVGYIRKMLDRHRNYRNIHYGAKLFSLLIFSMWSHRYINRK